MTQNDLIIMISTCLKASDWVLISSSLFLGVAALFVPYLSELLKRKMFKPICKIDFNLSAPDCHLTYWTGLKEGENEVFYFRFLVTNIGKSTIKNCENVLEEVWRLNNTTLKFKKVKNFTPVNLVWSAANNRSYIDINPQRRNYCDLGYLPTLEYQKDRPINSFPDYHGDDIKFVLTLSTKLNSQPSCFPPGKYGLKILTSSENAKSQTSFFKITWSGIWKNNEIDLFKELVVEKVPGSNFVC